MHPRSVVGVMSCIFRGHGVMQNDDEDAERQSMLGLIVEHAYTVNAATTVSYCAQCLHDRSSVQLY